MHPTCALPAYAVRAARSHQATHLGVNFVHLQAVTNGGRVVQAVVQPVACRAAAGRQRGRQSRHQSALHASRLVGGGLAHYPSFPSGNSNSNGKCSKRVEGNSGPQ